MFAEDSFERNIRSVDVRIKPDLTGYGMLDFNRAAIDTMLIRGYKAAVEKTPELDAIRRWLGSDTLRITQPRAVNIARTPVLIDSVEVHDVYGHVLDHDAPLHNEQTITFDDPKK